MRIASLTRAAAAFVLLPACDFLEFEGDPAEGAFPAANFSTDDTARSDLNSVESACEAYCTVASDCGDETETAACVDACVEPKLEAMALAPNTEATVDCATQYSATMACAMEPVCDDFAACDQAVDEYVTCSLAME